MKLLNIQSYLKKNRFILSGDMVLTSGKKHTLYFEVDKKFRTFVGADASAFLAAALPISMRTKEDLFVEGPISKLLIKSTQKIMNVLNSWNVGLHKQSIKAEMQREDTGNSNLSGVFFSGGVDSFYTFLKHKNKIRYLIFVHGYDIQLDDVALYNEVLGTIETIAKKQGVQLLTVRTNIRDIFEQYFTWDMSHEFALASVSLFLRQGFKEIYMSCGQTSKKAPHHYMTPELDTLWSTEAMKIHHFGCTADKISKLNFLSKSKTAMETLRVCWTNKRGEYNCCECEKCFRNMLALYAVDALEKCKTFKKPIDTHKLKKIKVNSYVLKYFISLFTVLKKKNDTSEIRMALEACIRNNEHPNVLQKITRDTRAFIREVDKKYNQNRFYWFLARRALI